MSFQTAAATLSQAIGLSAVFGATAITDLVRVACSTSWDQQVSEATLTTLSFPAGLTPGADVQVTVTINGESHLLYRGQYVDQGRTFDGGTTVSLVCRGILGMLGEPWGGADRIYNADLTNAERHDGAVIVNLIEACGIPSSRHSIVDSVLLDSGGAPGVWLLGAIQDVVLAAGTAPLELVNQIDEVVGYITVDQLDGFIERFENSPAGSGAGTDATFAEGTDGVRISRRRTSTHQIVNKWIVKGLTYEGVELEYTDDDTSAILDALRPGTAPNYNARTFQSDLMETQNHVQRVAEQRLSFFNRAQDGFEIELHTARPDIRLLDSVTFTYSSLGVSSTATVLIKAVSIDVDLESGNAATVLLTNGGTLATNAVP
jgi:hypothetical protein